ncbi:MAG: hypothetical protein LBF78_16070 [Treponema sp.]|nr:hypothetical protein [Treponema sp.]
MSFWIYHREVGVTSGNGKGDGERGRRRPWRRGRGNENRREKDEAPKNRAPQSGQSGKKGGGSSRKNDRLHFDRSRGVIHERPRWTPPQLLTDPLPVPNCPWCGRPIKDIASAIADKDSGAPVHFDCIIARLSEQERLEQGESIAYIGGGRFGIIHYASTQNPRSFTIKKIVEWENKDSRAEWRGNISDHYSIT